VDKRWNILPADEEKVAVLASQLKINPVLCRILAQRGITDFEKARSYFRPQLDMLHSPWLMKDMRKAVDRLIQAFNTREKILVYGDYDVDGTTSVASMFSYLSKVYDPVLLDFYIPHRYKEGYGVSKMGIDYAKLHGFNLIICLDCGIKSTELIAYAQTLGIEFIVCDHHLPGETLPDAVAILNAKQKDCTYPYKELCGCGVGFKLMSALTEELSLTEPLHLNYLDLVATAIAADIVPMTGENRVMAYYGLEKINSSPRPGIAALIKLGGITKKLSITNVVFVIAPRVNAAGRMDDARKAVQLFIEEDKDKALAFAEMLHSDNSERKETDSFITDEALGMLKADPALSGRNSSVVYKEHWHKGVVGIVASRLIEHYYRPTVVLTRSGDLATGSARSIAGFNLYEAIYECREYLLAYGGHFAAAGLTMLPENIEAFKEKFESVVSSTIDQRLLTPEIIIDSVVNFNDLTSGFYNIITQMEPFGPENLRPLFIAKNVNDTGYSRIVKDCHIKFVLKQDNITLSGIGFNMAEKFYLLQMKKPLDVLFTLDENEWDGIKSIQLKVTDIRISQ